MKKLILLLALLIVVLTTSTCQENVYLNYYEGNIPILILSTHGGSLRSDFISDRDCDVYTCVTDLNTDDLLDEIHDLGLLSYFRPSILVNYLSRKEVDLNRPVEEACNEPNKICAYYYGDFHDIIKEFIQEHQGEKVLILDMHGHGHPHDFIELGYNIELPLYHVFDTVALPSIIGTSVNAVPDLTIEESVRGNYSLGTLLSYYYPTTPSKQTRVPPSPYFNGGYITETYSQYKDVVVIQVELPYYIRKNKRSREEFLQTFLKIITSYYEVVIKK